MYIKDLKVYADTGEKLVAFTDGHGNTDTLNEALKNGLEINDVSIYVSPSRTVFLNYAIGCSLILPSRDVTAESLRKAFMELGYSDEEQLKVLLAKDKSDADAETYENMLVWMDFADKASRLCCEPLGVNVEETIDSIKREKMKEISKYDSSAEVNSFEYQGMNLWLDKATRVGLMNSTAILMNAGEKDTTLWLGNVHVTLPCEQVVLMLSKIEMYALECYNKTAEHKANVEKMTEIEEVKAYDHRAGYPERLKF